ncbi:MAG TPA: GAF and ANTAR domain-containing protein [Pseudonocardiaceae bacterium]|nr:GAF and ANTAR domain-containing protein [Pseudonocardiaceae bacterium]
MSPDLDPRGQRGEPSTSDQGSAAGEDQLARQLSALARDLQEKHSLQDTLNGIAQAAVDNVPGAQFAGITVVKGRREVQAPAWTDELVRVADHLQYETGQGPCLESVYEQQTVRVADMRTEQRWPKFARRAAELGVRSMLSIQLYVTGDNLGALNMYSEAVEAFDDASEHVGLLLGAHAAIAMAGAQQQEQLVQAIATRDLIGQAKGILMERHKITAEQAFMLLIQASQLTNIKLRDVAENLTTTGVLAPRERQ